MNVIFAKVTDEKNQIVKTLRNQTTKVCVLKDNCSVVNPVLTLAYDSNILTKNYCYIAEFGRYYYITDITFANKTLIVSLHCDVLMSYRDDILSSVGHITRTTNRSNKYLPDSFITNTAQVDRQYRKLGTGFTTANTYVLTIAG